MFEGVQAMRVHNGQQTGEMSSKGRRFSYRHLPERADRSRRMDLE